MAFLETPRLDPMITQGARSTVMWKRNKVYTTGGKLRQAFKWTNNKHTLDLSYRPRPVSDFAVLTDFYNVIFANELEGFRAKNWADYQLTAANSVLTFNGVDWQIQRHHVVGAYEYLKNITKPVAGLIIKRTRATAVTSVPGAVIDFTTGRVVIGDHVAGDTYTPEGEFDIPVTFVSDEWIQNFRGTSSELWISSDPILLEEIRLILP